MNVKPIKVNSDELDKQTAKRIEHLGAQPHANEFTPHEDRIIIACRKKHIAYIILSKEFMPHHSSASIKFRYLNYLK